MSNNTQLEEMFVFYKMVFGFEVNMSSVVLPMEHKDFDWLLLVPANMTIGVSWDKCEERLRCGSNFGEMDVTISRNARDPKKIGTYAIRLRSCIDADEECVGTSFLSTPRPRKASITLLERILLELWYNWKNGGRLDIKNGTICLGSCTRAGIVPSAGWPDYNTFSVYSTSGASLFTRKVKVAS